MTFFRNHFNDFDGKSKKRFEKKAGEIHKKMCQRVSRVEWYVKKNFLTISNIDLFSYSIAIKHLITMAVI